MTFRVFSLWAFVLIGRPQDIFPFIQPFSPALLLTIVTSVLVFFKITGTKASSLLRLTEVRRYIPFFLIMILGIPFAYHRRVAFNHIFLFYLMNVLFFLLFIFLIDSFEKLKSITLVVSVSTFFYSLFSLIKGAFSHGRLITQGSMFDPNDIAYVLVSLFPLSFFFLREGESFLKKAVAVITVVASIIVIVLTGSRTGVLGLLTVLLLLLFTNLGNLRRYYKVLFFAGLIVFFMVFREKINIERYLTLAEIGSDYNVTAEFGRFDVWGKTIQLILSNPITGVGVGCSPMAIGYLRDELDLIPRWQAVHNSYLQVAVETGLIGFMFFISAIVCCLRNFYQRGRDHAISNRVISSERLGLNALAGTLLVGFIGNLVGAFFLTQGYSIFFTLFFAFSAVLRKFRPI